MKAAPQRTSQSQQTRLISSVQPNGRFTKYRNTTWAIRAENIVASIAYVKGRKGFGKGAAWVSQKHGNFITNHGEARPADIEQLIEHVQSTVERMHGVRLHPEVRIVGTR